MYPVSLKKQDVLLFLFLFSSTLTLLIGSGIAAEEWHNSYIRTYFIYTDLKLVPELADKLQDIPVQPCFALMLAFAEPLSSVR